MRILRERLFTGVAGLILGALYCSAVAADVTVEPASQGYDIDVTEGTTASELLDAVADAAGVEIKGEPEDTEVSANHLRNVSLERAFRMLLPKAPFAIKYDADDTPNMIVFLSPSAGATDDGDTGADSSDTPDDENYTENDPSDPG